MACLSNISLAVNTLLSFIFLKSIFSPPPNFLPFHIFISLLLYLQNFAFRIFQTSYFVSFKLRISHLPNFVFRIFQTSYFASSKLRISHLSNFVFRIFQTSYFVSFKLRILHLPNFVFRIFKLSIFQTSYFASFKLRISYLSNFVFCTFQTSFVFFFPCVFYCPFHLHFYSSPFCRYNSFYIPVILLSFLVVPLSLISRNFTLSRCIYIINQSFNAIFSPNSDPVYTVPCKFGTVTKLPRFALPFTLAL